MKAVRKARRSYLKDREDESKRIPSIIGTLPKFKVISLYAVASNSMVQNYMLFEKTTR